MERRSASFWPAAVGSPDFPAAAKAATSGGVGLCASNAGRRGFRRRTSGCGAAFPATYRSAIACRTCRGCIGRGPAGSSANRRPTKRAIDCWRGFRGCGTCIPGMSSGGVGWRWILLFARRKRAGRYVSQLAASDRQCSAKTATPTRFRCAWRERVLSRRWNDALCAFSRVRWLLQCPAPHAAALKLHQSSRTPNTDRRSSAMSSHRTI